MASAKTDKTITLRGVRFSYLYAFSPFQGDNGDSYTCHGLMEPGDANSQLVIATMKELVKAKWGDQADEMYAALKGKDKLALHVGATSKPGEEAYKGKVFISANSKTRPTVVETRGGQNVQLTAQDGRPRSGDYGNLILNIWIQDNKYGKRINAQLMGVQYVRKGPPLGGGGRVASVEEFGVEASDADGEEPGTQATSAPTETADDLLG